MNIGVFFGGKNTEHDVSIITGQLIISGLKDLGHNVYPVYISKKGKFYSDERLGSLEFFKELKDESGLKKVWEVSVNFDDDGTFTLKTTGLMSKSYTIDMAFPALHGRNGEDGTIQGLFELLNVAYVGCDVVSSAITIDKVWTKLFYQKFNFPTTKFVYFETLDWVNNKQKVSQEIKSTLRWPVFIKPARLGSSIGIAKVKSDDELENAIEVALHYDSKVLVEESVEDLMDITVCIIGNDDPKASLIQESAYSQDFFSYEDKYLKEGGAQLGNAEKSIIIPARLDEKTTTEIQEMAKDIYKKLGCSGIARVDFLYDKTFKKYYANEINPLPGTIYHHLWKKSGIELNDLLTELLNFAKEKHYQKNKITYVFDSTILQKSSSAKLKLRAN